MIGFASVVQFLVTPPQGVSTSQVLLAEDCMLDEFPDQSQDMVVSNLWLHWVNDLPGLLREVGLH